MRLYKTIMALSAVLVCLAVGIASAAEPGRPNVDQVFSPEKEARIGQLAGLSVQEVFQDLRAPEFISEDEVMSKAIHVAFQGREAEAVRVALGYVRSEMTQKGPEGPQNLYVARKVLQVFPDDAVDSLLDLYSSGGPKVRRNVIYVMGEMAGGDVVKALLLRALDDTAFCEEALPETVGEPLRICDVAYNQLVIRYKVQDVLRTIGTGHSMEVRDHHIAVLKSREF
jgi:hypothetical protein